MLALHVLGPAHPADGLVLAAVRALGDQLEALQAEDADEPPGQLGGAKPGLAAGGTNRAAERASLVDLVRHLGRPPQATVAALSVGHVPTVATEASQAWDLVPAQVLRGRQRPLAGRLHLVEHE